MKIRRSLYALIALAVLAILVANGQTSRSATSHYEKGDISFDYPAEWKLIDRSKGDVEYIAVGPEGGAAQIAVIARFGTDQECDFQTANKKTLDALVERIADQIHANRPLQPSAVRTRVGLAEMNGLELRGVLNNHPVISEVYSLRLNLHFVSLVYLRNDEYAPAQTAWELIRTTLKLKSPVFNGTGVAAGLSDSTEVLNGRALRLMQPVYPAIARQARAEGTVVVQVVVDELGNVASAKALSGHPLLQAGSVAAAKESKFSPTSVCGEPVRIMGVIEYNFYL